MMHITWWLRVILFACFMRVTQADCPYMLCECEIHDGRALIECSGLDLEEVPPSEPSELKYDELHLSENAISSLPDDMFRHVPVRILDLSQNVLRNISDGAFEGLSQSLEVLRLGLSSEAEFPSGAIKNLTRLKELIITGYDRPSLPHNALHTLRNLEKLSLEKGRLQSLFAEDVSSQNESLISLSLRENRLSVIPGAVSVLRNLSVLNLATNSIDDIQSDAIPSVKELDLSQNGIHSLHANSLRGSHNSLEVLKLSHCLLSETHLAALKTLIHINQLDLSHNKIARLPNGLFSAMSHLKDLDLRANSIVSLENGTFHGLTATRSLNLKYNELRNVAPGSFDGMTSLQELLLDGQNLSAVLTDVAIFQGIGNTLEMLSLIEVAFSEENWPTVKILTNLRSFVLSTNDIRQIPRGTFTQWPHLHTVDLSRNLISNIDGVFSGLQASLKTVMLNSNNISELDRCTFVDFDQLERINMAGNPLRCDCGIVWLVYWIEEHYKVIERLTLSWRCDNGDLFHELNVKDLMCSVNETQVECVTTTLPQPTTAAITTTEVQTTTVAQTTVDPYISYRIVFLNATNLTDTSMLLRWGASDNLSGFNVVYHIIGKNQPTHSVSHSRKTRSAYLNGLVPERAYNICIRVPSDHMCITATTKPSSSTASDVSPSSANWQVILGVTFAIVASLLIIAAVAFYIRQQRHHVEKPGFTERLRVAYDSKRFSRPSNARIGLDNENNTRLERKMADIGGDDCGQCSARAVSSASADRYVPDLPPRNDQGYMNPVSLKDEHIYTEIPEISISHM